MNIYFYGLLTTHSAKDFLFYFLVYPNLTSLGIALRDNEIHGMFFKFDRKNLKSVTLRFLFKLGSSKARRLENFLKAYRWSE